METIFTTAGAGVRYKIIPDLQLHMGPQPELSYLYKVYKDAGDLPSPGYKTRTKEDNDENYMGAISIEEPGNIFVYTPGGDTEIPPIEMQELIDVICHYRHYHFSESF